MLPVLPAGKRSVTVPTAPLLPQASSRQPQPDKPQPLHSSRLTDSADEVPIGYAAAPLPSTAPSSWTNTESFNGLLPCALSRIHSLYSCVGSAGNRTSK